MKWFRKKVDNFFRTEKIISDPKNVWSVSPGISFKRTMELTEGWMSKEDTVDEKIRLLDFVMDMIREDLKSSLLTAILYKPKEPNNDEENEDFGIELPRYLFPNIYQDEKGNKIQLIDEEKEKTRIIDLSKTCIWTIPWKQDRLKGAVTHLFKRDFHNDPTNHHAYYYEDLDVCYVFNGRHSATAGAYYKTGEIKAWDIDIRQLYEHIYSDGVYWYNSHTKKACSGLIYDFRIAILYELAKLKYKVGQKNL